MEKTIGTRIGERRRAKGMKQEELAEKLGVSAQAVSKWENDVSCPDITLLPKLAKLLNVSVDELLCGEAPEKPAQYLPPEERKKFDEMMLLIKVDSTEENTRVRVNLPLPLIKVFLETGGTVENLTGGKVKGNFDLAQIMTMAENGMIGKLLEVDSDDCHVEIAVE